MSDFEVTRFLSFGQYVPTGSVLHRLDPRVKLLSIVLLTATFMAHRNFTVLSIGLLGVLFLFPIAKINIRHVLRSLIPLLRG